MKIGIRCLNSFKRSDNGRVETEYALLLLIAILVCLAAVSVIDGNAMVAPIETSTSVSVGS
ncbi:MAG TPA: hypothetical protein VND64_03475 [Pirellulales bacterium]|nr:hypothetical protein [Pirellulales bacterium]